MMNFIKKSGALAISLGIFLTRISGFIRDRIFAHYFGTSLFAESYKLAQVIPNFMQNMLGEGVLSASFTPTLVQLQSQGKEKEARILAGSVFSALCTVVSFLVVLGILLAPYFTPLIASGFSLEALQLTILLVQIFFPGIGFLVLSAWCLGILNSFRHFLLPYLAPMVMNLTIIGGLIFWGYALPLQPSFDELEKFIIYVTITSSIGSLFVFLIQIPKVVSILKGFPLHAQWKNIHFKEVVKNFLPTISARGTIQISVLIDKAIATHLVQGSIAILSYTQMLALLPVSLFGMAISASELTELSSISQNKKYILLRLEKGLSKVLFFVIPSAVAYIFLGRACIGTVYQTGEFTSSQTTLVWTALAGASLGLPAVTRSRILSSAFYSLKDTKTPFYISLIRIAINISLSLGCVFLFIPLFHFSQYGAMGLTLASSIASWIEFYILRKSLEKKLENKIRTFQNEGIKIVLCSFLSVIPSFFISLYLTNSYHPIIEALIILPLMGTLYLIFSLFFKIHLTTDIINKIKKKKN